MVRKIGICYYNERGCLLSYFVARWRQIALMGTQIDDADAAARENKTERRGERWKVELSWSQAVVQQKSRKAIRAVFC